MSRMNIDFVRNALWRVENAGAYQNKWDIIDSFMGSASTVDEFKERLVELLKYADVSNDRTRGHRGVEQEDTMKCEIGHTIPVPELRLFHSRGRMTAWCAERGIPNECMEFLDADAQTWTWKKDSEIVCVVLLENMADDLSDAALLAHEAVHVACNTLDVIGEDDYGEETLAYLVEAFTLALLRAHRKWMDKHSERGGRS